MKSPYSTNSCLIIHPFSDDLDLKSSLIDRAKKIKNILKYLKMILMKNAKVKKKIRKYQKKSSKKEKKKSRIANKN